MIIRDIKYAENEYEGLVRELVKSPDLDGELQYYRQSVLDANPNFYLLMFRTVDRIRTMATLSGDNGMIAGLNRLQDKLYEYTDVIPADLPPSILQDRRLVRYLADQNTITFKMDAWYAFQNYIREKTDEMPGNLVLPFLSWCFQMLKMNLSKHEKVCKNPENCAVNQGYDKRILFVSKMIEDVAPPQPVVLPYAEPILQPQTVSSNMPDTMKKTLDKIQWLGTQKELAELFIYLKAKGWIAEFEPETIKDCFTGANTIQQLLKPGQHTDDLGGTFEQVFTPEYVPKFFGIAPNTKRSN